jgi:vanillate O-demethylase ferredoxin subunit
VLAAKSGGTLRRHFSDQVVSDFTPMIGPWRDGSHLYCCGPAGLMDAVRLGARGWPSANVHFESFQAAPIDHSHDRPFEIELARSGAVLSVPAGKSILETLRDNGYDAPSSCEEGICGSCEMTLVEGDPDHRDRLLTDDEVAANDRIMICVSRSRGGRLVLDL